MFKLGCITGFILSFATVFGLTSLLYVMDEMEKDNG